MNTSLRLTIFYLCLLTVACDRRQKLPEACGEGTREKGGLYDIDGDGYLEDVDCDEGDCTINPGSKEICDGLDNDCDDNIDGADDDLKELTRGETEKFYIDKDCDGWCEDDTRTLCVKTDISLDMSVVRSVFKGGDGSGGGELQYAFTTCSAYVYAEDDGEHLIDISDYIYKGHEEEALGSDWHDYFDDCGDEDCETDPYCTYPDWPDGTDPENPDYDDESTLNESCLSGNGPDRTCAYYASSY